MPLLARDRVLGAITFAQAESGRVDGIAQLELARQLASRAAIAIDHAQLYAEAEQRAQAARVLAAVGDAVFLVDREGFVRLWNTAAGAITGLDPDRSWATRVDEVLPGWAQLSPLIPVASRPGELVRAETVPLELGGRELWISGSGVGFDDGTIYAFRDLTEERALEALKAEFVATVSHELRTPLAAIYGAAQTIRRTDIDLAPDVRDQLLEVIATESDRLGAIVSDLLVAGRLDADQLPVAIEPCDPVDLAGSVLDMARAHLPEAIDLELRAAGDVHNVAADPGQLRQVLVNLVDNAIKYSPEGGLIEVSIANGDGAIRFTITDHGLGIPASEHRRIFEKFYRLDPAMTRGIGGTGLGLYICRELVRRMDGSIWVESKLGEGSTFVVELPAAADGGPPCSSPRSDSARAAERLLQQSARPGWLSPCPATPPCTSRRLSNSMAGIEPLAGSGDHGGSILRTPWPPHDLVRGCAGRRAPCCTVQHGPNFHGVPQRCSFNAMPAPSISGDFTLRGAGASMESREPEAGLEPTAYGLQIRCSTS